MKQAHRRSYNEDNIIRIIQNLKKVKISHLKKGLILSHPFVLPVVSLGQKLHIWEKINQKISISIRKRGYTISLKIMSHIARLSRIISQSINSFLLKSVDIHEEDEGDVRVVQEFGIFWVIKATFFTLTAKFFLSSGFV